MTREEIKAMTEEIKSMTNEELTEKFHEMFLNCTEYLIGEKSALFDEVQAEISRRVWADEM